MYSFVPGEMDMVQVHRQQFGFPVDAGPEVDERLRDALALLKERDAWGRLRRGIEEGASRLQAEGGVRLPDELNILMILGDPENSHFMEEVKGLSGFGGITGFIVLTLWPHEQVLDRLEAIAAHELHHNVRYAPGGVVWNPATVTVGEHVVAEGLADLFAVELYGERGWTHFVREQTRRSDGVLEKVEAGLGITGMQNFGAWVLGDATARLFGGEPVGLPTGAGYAAGARLAARYLEERGATAAASVWTPSEEIIATAGRRGGHRISESSAK